MVAAVSGTGSMGATSQQIRQALFRKLDTNGDGVIDKTEMKAALETGKKTSARKAGASLERAFGKLDTDKDGVISQSEFAAALSSAQNSTGGLPLGGTSSLVDFLTSSSSAGSAASPSSQKNATNNLLKNYLSQVSQLAGLQTSGGFTRVV